MGVREDHDEWNEIEKADDWWLGYRKLKGGWLIKTVKEDEDGGNFGVGITFAPDPDHKSPPEIVG